RAAKAKAASSIALRPFDYLIENGLIAGDDIDQARHCVERRRARELVRMRFTDQTFDDQRCLHAADAIRLVDRDTAYLGHADALARRRLSLIVVPQQRPYTALAAQPRL